MRKDRFQNIAAGSAVTLPLCAVLATVLWCCPDGPGDWVSITGWVLSGLVTYILAQTNNVHTLVRIPTRLLSSSWLLMVACMGFMHPLQSATLISLSLSVSYFLLFCAYQRRVPTPWIFHSFLCLGAGCIFFPHMLLVPLLFYFYLVAFLRSLTWKGFWAGFIGLFLPFWVWGGTCAILRDFSPLVAWYRQLICWPLPTLDDYRHMSVAMLVAMAVPTLFVLVGMVHYLYTKYDDKIKVRMFFYVYVVQTVVFWLLMLAQPQHRPQWLALFLVSGSPLVAHYFALTHSWISNLMFYLFLLMLGGMAFVTIWMPWLSF